MLPLIVFLARSIWAGRVNRKQCRQSLWTRSTLLNPSSKKRCCVMIFERAGDRRVWSVEKVVHQVSWKLFEPFQTRVTIPVITSYVKFVTSVQERQANCVVIRWTRLSWETLSKDILTLLRHVNPFMSMLHATNLSVHLSDVNLCISLQRIMFSSLQTDESSIEERT